MKENFRRLRAQQIDRMVQPLRSVKLPRPPRGWIRALREAMGVSSSELARRLKANRSLASQQEKAEVDDRITLRSLRACAPFVRIFSAAQRPTMTACQRADKSAASRHLEPGREEGFKRRPKRARNAR